MAETKIDQMSADNILAAIVPLVSNGVSLIDALVLYADRNGIEIEAIGEIMKKSSFAKERIREEAINNRMVKADDSITTIF